MKTSSVLTSLLIGVLVIGLNSGCASTKQASSNGSSQTNRAGKTKAPGETQRADDRTDNMYKEAVAALEGDDGDIRQVIDSLEEVTRQRPDFGSAWYKLGRAYDKSGEGEKAVDAYNKALDKSDNLQGRIKLSLGAVYGDLGQTERAKKIFEGLIENDSDLSSSAHSNLSALYRQSSSWDKAVRHARMALASDAEHMDAYVNLAKIYYQRDYHSVAELVILNAMEAGDPTAPLYNTFGLVNLAQDKVTEAIDKFKRALDIDQTFVSAHMNLGAVRLNVRDYNRARTHFKAVLDERPDHVMAKISKGVAHRGLGELNEAKKLYEAVIEEHPEHPVAQFNLAVLQHEHLAQNASLKAKKSSGDKERSPAKQIEANIEAMTRAVEHYKKALKHYRASLQNASESSKVETSDTKSRIDTVEQLIKVTKQQLPGLRDQMKRLKNSGGSEAKPDGSQTDSKPKKTSKNTTRQP
jgi:tetratricopeptide (TPR) repeat protein